jgi:TPP-dependent pyruvate/acetoin dehydrogenase alpha subunit
MTAPLDVEASYRAMRTIREFEDWVATLATDGEIAGATHEYSGQEAVAVGVCGRLRADDIITSTHRGHGHLIAKGASVHAMMAELMGRATGLNRGRGGSMHAADLSLGILGANGIVAAGAPIAAGAAWAAKARGDAVAVTFFGDGGVNQGVLAETMNLAAIWKLPLIFACENNGYAVTLRSDTAIAGSAVDRAAAYGMPAERVNGMDVRSVADASEVAVARARAGDGPSFLEFETYRFTGHNTGERYLGLSYRTDDEITGWRLRDPLDALGNDLPPGRRDEIDDEVVHALAAAVDAARADPVPDPDTAADFMYADLQPRRGVR